MPAPARVGSFGGGGGGGGRRSSNSRYNQDLNRAAACKQPGSEGSSIKSSGDGGCDLPDSDEYYMSMDRSERCGIYKRLLEKKTRDGRKLSLFDVRFFERYLVDCPDVPNLKKLADDGENSDSLSFDEYFMAKKPESRCWIVMLAVEKALQKQKELDASQIAYFKKLTGDCPNVPDFLS